MLRAIVLSIALLVGMGTIIPIATEYAEASKGSNYKKKKKQKRYWRGVKKYSKRWWQLYNAQERRKKQRRSVARKLKLQQLRLEKADGGNEKTVAKAEPKAEKATVAMLPTGDAAPKGWKAGNSSSGEVKFRVENGAGSQIGSASISVVGPASDAPASVASRTKTVGGVPTTSLRREVINQMVRENGWVVNDYRKDIGGKEVYVVVAQSQAKSGNVESRMFYFTEANGRIYSVATNSATDSAERLADESEKVINSLHGRRPVQQASVKSVVIERPAAKQTELPPCAMPVQGQ